MSTCTTEAGSALEVTVSAMVNAPLSNCRRHRRRRWGGEKTVAADAARRQPTRSLRRQAAAGTPVVVPYLLAHSNAALGEERKAAAWGNAMTELGVVSERDEQEMPALAAEVENSRDESVVEEELADIDSMRVGHHTYGRGSHVANSH